MSVVFDRAAGFYDDSRGLPPEVEELVTDRVEEAVGPAGRLLEVGAGTGRIALPLHRRGRVIVGVDLSLPMLARYRAKAAAAGLAPPPVARADATRLPLRDASVDAVLSVHVLHLVPSWERALAEARRVLAPGGVLLLAGGGAYERGGGGPRDQVMRRFDELAAAAGTGTPRQVGGSRRQVLDRLGAMGGRVEALEPVAWEEQETYAEALRWVEGRVFSHHWRLPDEVWRAAADRVRAEFAGRPDLDTPRPARHTFGFVATRF